MTYEQTLSRIYGLGRFGMKPGLERITALLAVLHNPHHDIQTVQVAGTNGKGSTAAFLAAILAGAGVKTGLFTSPHLIGFTERIRVDGVEIGKDEVVRLAAQVQEAAPGGTTFFEIVTAMALCHFAAEKVDLAIMETGMGGRFDATNVVAGRLSVITPVGLDHCEHLGRTVAAIAGEKGGIIKPGCPVVVAPQPPEALAVLSDRCRELNASLYRCGVDFDASWQGGTLSYRGLNVSLTGLRPGIGGSYQAVNAACALAAAELLSAAGFTLPVPALGRGIEEAVWPGRMEFFPTVPRLLLDGAHNGDGAVALAAALAEVPRKRLILVIGLMGDKEVAAILAPLLPLADEVVAVTPLLPRALPAEELSRLCGSPSRKCCAGGSVARGLALAMARAGADDLVLVTGSLFTVGEARALLLERPFEPMRG